MRSDSFIARHTTDRDTWALANTACTAVERRLDDPMLTEVWGARLTRLDLDVTASGPVGAFVRTVEQR